MPSKLFFSLLGVIVLCTGALYTGIHPASADGGVLRLGQNAADLGTLDPHFAATTNDRSLVDAIFNGLIRYKPGDGTVFEPDLAENLPTPTMVNGKQVWTFTLRKGVMCHPSSKTEAYELTADDVVYSLQKSANPKRSAYAGEYDGMKVEAIDPYTVKFTLDVPLSSALFFPKVADYAGGFIVCKKAIEALGDETFKTQPVGTGPFMFKSYTPQEKVVLVANPQYFRGRPLLDAYELYFMPDINSRELALQAGELEVINGAPEKIWVDKMAHVPNVTVDVFGVGEVATLHMNFTKPPLDKLEVRQAIAYAISREELLVLFGEPVVAPVYSPVPAQFLPGGLTREEVAAMGLEYKVDRAKAKELLTKAGYPDGFSMDLYTTEMIGYRKIYENMQAQLAEVGIKINLKVVDHSSYHKLIRQDANPMVLYIAWRPNADVYLTRFFHSDSIVVTGKKPDTNFSHYNKIDDLILAARKETDPEKQIALWKEAQKKILTDMVAHTLQAQNQVYARNKAVDYGHELKSVLALYPQITEKTRLRK